MDRLAVGHPIVELSDLYYFYVILGEEDPAVVEKFMGFSYETANRFLELFLKHYLQTDDEVRLNEIRQKASIIGYSRMIRKIRKKRKQTDADQQLIRRCVKRIAALTDKLDNLAV